MTGFLFVDDFSNDTGGGDELTTIPYTYTVGLTSTGQLGQREPAAASGSCETAGWRLQAWYRVLRACPVRNTRPSFISG